jgi:hypothetical protein
MATALQSALTWDDQATISVSIVCEAEDCDFSIEITEKDSLTIAREHMRGHLIDEARARN